MTAKLTSLSHWRGEKLQFLNQLENSFPAKSKVNIHLFANRISSLARLLGKLYLKVCNEPVEQPIHSKIVDSIETRVAKLCKEFGFAIILKLPNGNYNSWSGDGWGVPQEL